MKLVPNGREERESMQGRDPSAHEEKQPVTGPPRPTKEQCQQQARLWSDYSSDGEGCARESDASYQGGQARVERPCW